MKFFKDSKGNVLAILISREYSKKGIEFVTDNDAYQQVAYMGHSAGHVIVPHYHNKIERKIELTCETLIMRKGLLEVILYENEIESHKFCIQEGDVLTLLSGGHGFRALEDIEMIEIKQGPFLGAEDKTRF